MSAGIKPLRQRNEDKGIVSEFLCPHSSVFFCLLFITTSLFAAEKYDNPTPWSYQRLQRPAIPTTKDTVWPKDNLDRVIRARLETENLRPIGDASRATLIRRTSFDLRGLPPSQTEVEALLRDPSPDDAAFAKVIDAFLQSERFGER